MATLTVRSVFARFLNLRREVLANAAVVEEDYFVAPPGNIPFKVDAAEDKYGR